ncbi:putative ornithine decarboxylase [Liquorilactobacillus mali]|uniref:putative ornithine decarboxylase n=1 Tax=Liquorilactobacillus mali TaxID=1618 RepID=UPI002350F004|nr:putative ornithine decarboxylase [Liquorilactobacillus mali]MDC7952605.1 putative ornithine decarboxylase [Liquorilactobacillus mali]
MGFLKIAVTQKTMFFLGDNIRNLISLNSETKMAEIAEIVKLKDETIPEDIRQNLIQSGLKIPIFDVYDVDIENKKQIEKIEEIAEEYERKSTPKFIEDLVSYAKEKPVSFTTPGHHGGKFYSLHPAGMIFKKFMGDNFFQADVSDTVTELGDTLTHAGTPLDAQKQAAKAYNADKVYFVTNGTTTANTICSLAALTAGDLVLFDRNNHKSLYNSALIMTGAVPVYIPTDRNGLGAIGPLDEEYLDEEKIREEISKVVPAKAKKRRPFRMAVIQLETYDGIIYDAHKIIKKIGPLCDYILFDCAWGGYEQFVPLMESLSAFTCNLGREDPGILVTQSVHKQQAGVAQSSQILKKDSHIKGQERYIDHKHFNHTYLKYVTTSYSYPVYASLAVNAYMAERNFAVKEWSKTLIRGIKWRKRLLDSSKLFAPFVPKKIDTVNWSDVATERLAIDKNAWMLNSDDLWHGFTQVKDGQVMQDPFKLIIKTPGVDVEHGVYERTGIPAMVVNAFLTEQRVMSAKADLNSLLFLLTPGDRENELERLLEKLLDFEKKYEENAPLVDVLPRIVEKGHGRYNGYTLKQLCKEMHDYYRSHQTFILQKKLFAKHSFQSYEELPSEADLEFIRNKGKLVELSQVKNKIALEGALPYPPGVFVVAPGEKWEQDDIDYFQTLLGAMTKFPGFDPEIQGVYLKQVDGKYIAYGYVKA